MITRLRNISMNKNMDVIALKKSSFLTHIIVSQGDWLWKPANIKGENNGSVVYFQSFLTVNNPIWRSDESTRLPQMWPWFNSQRWSHVWVEFVVGSLSFSERFFSDWSGFPLSLTTNSSKFQLDLEGTDTFQPVLLNS